jgi:YD repeat-containing protein
VFAQYGYLYDNADRITQITSPDGTATYTTTIPTSF